MNEKISLIIPVYNVEKYLKKCIDSAINQTYQNIEIILINDGSTDNSGKICEEYSRRYQNIIYVNKKNGGLSSARNAGIHVSKGDYLFFLDSDDYITEDCIESLYFALLKENTDISIGNYQEVYLNDEIDLKRKNREYIFLDNEQAFIEMLSHNTFNMSACNKLFKKYLFKEIEFPLGKKCEDYYIMYKLILNSKKISLIESPTYFYLQRTNSITKNSNVNIDFLIASYEQMKYVESNFPHLRQYAYSDYAMAGMAIHQEYKKRSLKINKEMERQLIQIKKDGLSTLN